MSLNHNIPMKGSATSGLHVAFAIFLCSQSHDSGISHCCKVKLFAAEIILSKCKGKQLQKIFL
jgi:hypothetical protein